MGSLGPPPSGKIMAYCTTQTQDGHEVHQLIKLGEGYHPQSYNSESLTSIEQILAWMVLTIFLTMSIAYIRLALLNRRKLQSGFAWGLQILVGACHWLCKFSRFRALNDEEIEKVFKVACLRRSQQALAALYILAPIVWLATLRQAWSIFASFKRHL